MVWVRLLGPAGEEVEETRVRVERGITTSQLRKAVGARVSVRLRELVLLLGGQVLEEFAARPLLDVPDDGLVVSWERGCRVRRLLSSRSLAGVNSLGKFDRTALHFAILDGDPDLCTDIVRSKDFRNETLNRRDAFHDSPLMLAATLGNAPVVELLVDRQANLECQNLCGRTALQMAAEHGHQRVCVALVAQGCSLGEAVARPGPMGVSAASKSAPYLAKLNGRSVHDRLRRPPQQLCVGGHDGSYRGWRAWRGDQSPARLGRDSGPRAPAGR